MQFIILTGRDGNRVRLSPMAPVWALALVCVAVAAAFSAGFRAGISEAPLARADAGFEQTAALLHQRHDLDIALQAAGRRLEFVDAFAAALGARVQALEAAAARVVARGGLAGEEFAAPRRSADSISDGAAGQATRVFARLEALKAHLADSEPRLNALDWAISMQNVRDVTQPRGRPVAKGWVSSRFGPRRDPVSGRRAFHDGMDFAGRFRTPILAVADGVVSHAERRRGYGNIVQITHGNGVVTRYAHNQKNLVKAGERVRRGDVIALMGSTGRSTGTHVHFEVLRHGKPVDPKPFVSATGQ
ncbi:MAG: M23 family metallopeptidase [Pseudomonadota bacterium]